MILFHAVTIFVKNVISFNNRCVMLVVLKNEVQKQRLENIDFVKGDVVIFVTFLK